MSDFVTDRELITNKVLQLLEVDSSHTNFNTVKAIWWRNIRSTGGLSLTPAGDQAFSQAGLESWDTPLTNTGRLSASAIYISLDRKIPCPYYLTAVNKTPILRVYDSRIAVTIALWKDIGELLNSLSYRDILIKKD